MFEAESITVDKAIQLCSSYNKKALEEKKTWRIDMFNFSCLVNADKEGRQKYRNDVLREKKILTPEQERESLLKLKAMLQ